MWFYEHANGHFTQSSNTLSVKSTMACPDADFALLKHPTYSLMPGFNITVLYKDQHLYSARNKF